MEKFKYAKCEISYSSDPYYDCETPSFSILIFSEDEIAKIKKHMKYAVSNGVTVRYKVVAESYLFEEEEGLVPVVAGSFDMTPVGLILTSEYIYICNGGFFYKGYSEDGQVYIESDYFNIDSLKEIVGWPEEI